MPELREALPCMEGSITRDVRARGSITRDVRVNAAQCDTLTGGAIGVVDWLSKPIDETALRAALRKAAQYSAQATPAVLYIEDDRDLGQVVAAMLEPGLSVTHVSTLTDGFRQLSSQRFSLIILDINLPDGNGAELLARLPALNASTPVLIFSGQDSTELLLENVAMALVKSRTSNQQLLATIHTLIGKPRIDSPLKEST